MTISRLHFSRWRAAQTLVTKKILPLFDLPNIDVLYDGVKISKDSIVIDVARMRIMVKVGNSAYFMYDGDPDYDEGAYDTIGFTADRIRNKIVAYRSIKY